MRRQAVHFLQHFIQEIGNMHKVLGTLHWNDDILNLQLAYLLGLSQRLAIMIVVIAQFVQFLNRNAYLSRRKVR